MAPADLSHGDPGQTRTLIGTAQWQVFGARGRGRMAVPIGRRFPTRLVSASGDGRSHIPLRGSSGFIPDSLLPRRTRYVQRTN